MEGVVDVDADAAVQVLRGIHDAVRGLRRPELRDRHLGRGREAGREPPRRLPRGQADRLDVDVGVRGTLVHGLEARDRAVELLAARRVLRGQPERPLGHAELHRRESDERALDEPADIRTRQGVAGGAVEDEPRLRLAVGGQLPLERDAAAARVEEEDADVAVRHAGGHEDACRQMRRGNARLDAVEPP